MEESVILQYLSNCGERPVTQIRKEVNSDSYSISRRGLTKALARFVEYGYIAARKKSNKLIYSITDQGLKRLEENKIALLPRSKRVKQDIINFVTLGIFNNDK